jgi:hypothetical protein
MNPAIMKSRPVLLFLLLLLSGCGAHPDREAVSQLLEDLRPNEDVDLAQFSEYSGGEASVRVFTPQYVQQQQTLQDFLAEHPGITPATRQIVESLRDAVGERADIRGRMIEENRFDWTSENLERDRELARQQFDGMAELMKIVDDG